jgi:hypothetical protein
MKFYNPFRAHIVEYSDGSYRVRRLSHIGWEYYGDKASYWWCSEINARIYAEYFYLANARAALTNSKKLKSTLSRKVIT